MVNLPRRRAYSGLVKVAPIAVDHGAAALIRYNGAMVATYDAARTVNDSAEPLVTLILPLASAVRLALVLRNSTEEDALRFAETILGSPQFRQQAGEGVKGLASSAEVAAIVGT